MWALWPSCLQDQVNSISKEKLIPLISRYWWTYDSVMDHVAEASTVRLQTPNGFILRRLLSTDPFRRKVFY